MSLFYRGFHELFEKAKKGAGYQSCGNPLNYSCILFFDNIGMTFLEVIKLLVSRGYPKVGDNKLILLEKKGIL